MTARSRSSRAPRDEGGFTLVEVLVAVVIAAIVGGITVGIVARSAEQERSTTSHVTTLNEGKTALERMTRDIRAADPVLRAEPDEVVVVVRDGSSIRWRRWYASGGQLAVEQEPLDSDDVPEDWDTDLSESTTTQTLVRSLDDSEGDPEPFSYRDASGEMRDSADPEDVRAVRVELELESTEGRRVTLDDDITVRNARGE